MSRNNRTKKNNKKRKKRRRINKVKVLISICIFTIFVIGISKAMASASQMVKNIEVKRQIEIQKQKEIERKRREELEKKNGVDIEKKYTVVIDPGHGGNDPGNLGIKSPKEKTRVYEKDLNLEISKKVAAILSRQNDIQVILTRTEDETVELENRALVANSQKADVLVSIHMNAESGGNTANGVETYYKYGATKDDKSILLAKTIQKTIGAYVTMRDRGIKEANLQVLQESKMPAALVECGFITNIKERDKLLDKTYQNRLAEGIAQGILSFIDKTYRSNNL